MSLKLVAIGGLGKMLSPSALHLADGSVATYVRVLDRGNRDAYRDTCRLNWKNHGAELVATLEELVGAGEFDGVVICAGKNGDDFGIIQTLVPLLAGLKKNKRFFILHLSTVSCRFVTATNKFCEDAHIDYVNYPLTGGTVGASKATMLILAAGKRDVYDRVLPMLSKIGSPKYFGENPTLGTAVKLIGHVLLFSGLLGLSLGALLQQQVFPADSTKDRVDFFDFLNQGSGGTRQWDTVLRQSLVNDDWHTGFLLRHAAIDLIYTLELLQEKSVPEMLTVALCEVSVLFSQILQSADNYAMATQAIYRLLTTKTNDEVNGLIREKLDFMNLFSSCVKALPERFKSSLMLEVYYVTSPI